MLSQLLNQLHIPSPIEKLPLNEAVQHGVVVWIKREELIHPHISGNKWRKLKYNLVQALNDGSSSLISFGGAYSNHLVALASAGHFLGLKTCGIVRSYRDQEDNPTIRMLRQYGMELHFVHPDIYQAKENHPTIRHILHMYPGYFLIPEGGTNEYALRGIAEMVEEIDGSNSGYTHLITAIGTGGTIAGIVRALPNSAVKVLGISPFKGPITLLPGLDLLTQEERDRIELIRSVPETRFAARDKRIIDFIQTFHQDTGITLDPVYTSKVVMTTLHLITNLYFKKGDKVLILHTGGLQGIAGYLCDDK